MMLSDSRAELNDRIVTTCEHCMPRTMSGLPGRMAGLFVAAALLVGCANGNFNQPDNQPITVAPTIVDLGERYSPNFGETVVGLSFSGGGMRASAFSYGVIEEIASRKRRDDTGEHSLIDNVVFVSGVSGGSVPAAYVALRGAEAVPAFRDEFLYKNPQSSFNTSVSLGSIFAVLGGGLNNKTGFQTWLDENLFYDATFGDVAKREGAPILWVNASDVYSDTVFTFDDEMFSALCSDLDSFKLSEAVAAASAVPAVFSPVVIENFAGQCGFEEPAWVSQALASEEASVVVRNLALAFRRYQDREQTKYIKLFDGGVTDNLGVHGVITQRERYDSPIAPIDPKQAVGMKNLLFVVVNAATKTTKNFTTTIEGPSGVAGLGAVVDTLMATATDRTRDDFFEAMELWRNDMIEYRCSLSKKRVRELIGDRTGWDCRDVNFDVLDVSFAQVTDKGLLAKLEAIPTAYVLPQEQTDLLVKTAGDLLRNNPRYKDFLGRM